MEQLDVCRCIFVQVSFLTLCETVGGHMAAFAETAVADLIHSLPATAANCEKVVTLAVAQCCRDCGRLRV